MEGPEAADLRVIEDGPTSSDTGVSVARPKVGRWLLAAVLPPALITIAVAAFLVRTTELPSSSVLIHAAVGAFGGCLAAALGLVLTALSRRSGNRFAYALPGFVLFLLLFGAGTGAWIARRSWGMGLTTQIVLDFVPQTLELTSLLGWRAWALLGGWALASAVATFVWATALAHFDRGFSPSVRWLLVAGTTALAFLGFGAPTLSTTARPHLATDPLLGLFVTTDEPSFPPTAARMDAWVRDAELRRSFHAGEPRRKNLILLLSDGIRPNHLPSFGYARETMPFLASLWRDSGATLLPRAYSAATESLGGIGSIVSGRSPRTLSGRSYGIVEFLGNHGYRTHLLLGGDHFWYELRSIYGSNVTTFRDMRHNDPTLPVSDDRQITRWARELPPAGDEPAFIMIFFMGTHQMSTLSDEDEYFSTNGENRPLSVFYSPSDANQLQNAIDRYDDQLRATDRQLREIWRTLGEKGYLEDYFAMFSSDHGQMLGEHGVFGHGAVVWEDAIRIPFAVWSDRKLPPVALDRIAWTPDIAPTLADAAGLRPLPGWEGLSLFSGENRDSIWIDNVRKWSNCSAAYLDERDHIWKVNQTLDPQGRIRTMEFYDVAADPGETKPLDREIPAEARRKLVALAGGH